MEGSKEISFNEFLKDEALKPEIIPEETLHIESKESKKLPKMLAATPADEARQSQFWQLLRNYFHSGKVPVEYANDSILLSFFLAGIAKSDNFSSDYPIFISSDPARQCMPLSTLISSTYEKVFENSDSPIIQSNLPRLELLIKKSLADKKNILSLNEHFNKALKEISKIEVRGQEKENFEEDLQKFKQALPTSGILIDFTPDAHFRILNTILNNFYESKKMAFVARLRQTHQSINDLLLIEKDKESGSDNTSKLKSEFGFADQMIDFDRFKGIIPKGGSQQMPENRLRRIEGISQSIYEAIKWLTDQKPCVLLGDSFAKNDRWNWDEILPEVQLIKEVKGPICSHADALFNKQAHQFTKAVIAMHMATLELGSKYIESIHDQFFQNFSWRSISSEELEACPPVILIEESALLTSSELPLLTNLIASNKPVKILAISTSGNYEYSQNGMLGEESFNHKRELFATCMALRNAYIFQTGIDEPSLVYKAIQQGLSLATPSIWHFNTPSPAFINDVDEYVRISAATEGRQFARASYSPSINSKWGSRFDISQNPQEAENWPSYDIEYTNTDTKNDLLTWPFTYADFCALDPEFTKNLFIVSPEYWTDDLIPLHQYLSLSTSEIYSKIPFIWLVDSNLEMVKAAIHYPLVNSCMERLEFWNFLQELSGVNSYHVEQAVKLTEEKMNVEKEATIEKLIKDHESMLAEALQNAESDIMERLASTLLDLDSDLLANQAGKSSKSTKKEPTKTRESKEPVAPVEETEVKAEEPMLISQEPWIASTLCTTCNECTEKYPSAFKYNSDKQAIFTDYKSLTFAELVDSAEKCPAKCIHPGLPQNPNEPGLDDLIKRAQAFT